MNKTAIKNFAIAARRILMESAIEQAGLYGISKEKIGTPLQKGPDFEVYETIAGSENRIFGDDIKKRANLVKAIAEQGFEQVIEETAYTWFNRIIAIRFMEVNDYLPSKVRVLSSETGSNTPDIISQYQSIELNLTSSELDKIQDVKTNNNYDEAFRLLFIKQCNELNNILPGLFEKIDDYMELLLKIPYTSDGVVRLLIDTIPESSFNVAEEGQVEIIGWLYQYYNTELKDDTFAKLKKNIKITKERIPAATQLFTPDWIVRYMVENSLGRVWIEHLRAVDSSVDEKTKAEEFGWKYYLPEAEQEEEVAKQLVQIRQTYRELTPQDISCIDPCMGSGHILVYMFDVLMDIYKSEGYSEKEAVFDILEKNIRGLDIDRRAYQLSYFALMMKARGYNRTFFRGKEDINGDRIPVAPKVYAIEESNSIDRNQLQYYGAGLDEKQKETAIKQINGLLDTLQDAKEYGSILNVENYDWELLRLFVEETADENQISLLGYFANQSKNILELLLSIGETLAIRYDAVVTNPPYMAITNSSKKMYSYVHKNYSDSKADLFAVFISKCLGMANKNGMIAMITQHAWMFLSSFEKLRKSLYINAIVNMAHLGPRAFEEIGGEVVQTTAFSIKKSTIRNYNALYKRLVYSNSQSGKERLFFSNDSDYTSLLERYTRIPGSPCAYWVSDRFIDNFEKSKPIGETRKGMVTADNPRFIRNWSEVDYTRIGFGFPSRERAKNSRLKWFSYIKGGEYRKWYGNLDWVVNWENDGRELLNMKNEGYKVGSTNHNLDYIFKPAVCWTKISSKFAGRIVGNGFLIDDASPFISINDESKRIECLAFFNTPVCQEYLNVLNPTMNFSPGTISNIPILDIGERKDEVFQLVNDTICKEKLDWDSFENSWDFKEHPLVRWSKEIGDPTSIRTFLKKYNVIENETRCPLELCYLLWQGECNERFQQVKENEERLNRIFIDIYGLESELSPDVEEKDITIRTANLQRDIKSLISYAVGCMMGRYSLSKEGIAFAGGKFNESIYGSYPVDTDAIIPITDEFFFEDDVVGRFVDFIKTVYGDDSLENNLDYIADALETKGLTSRDKIRNYFIFEFFSDNLKTYQKRPIYWMFDSGKENGFKALIYMQRYTPDTVGLIRSDYLSKIQSSIENALKNAEYTIQTTSSAVDKAQAMKKQDKYIKQLAEIKAYYPALSHIALQRIAIDLDDGVKVNYAKFQGVEVIDENGKKQKIDLLAKI